MGVAVAMAATPALSAPSGKFSWFNGSPHAGGLNPVETRLLGSADSTTFGMEFSSPRPGILQDSRNGIGLNADTVRLYGDVESTRLPDGYFSAGREPAVSRVNFFGVAWQHRLNELNTFAVSAEYGEGSATASLPLDTFDTRAALSWTSVLRHRARPSITSSVFVGDETARDDINRHLGRRYYGFAVGSSLTLFQSHTPYVSFKMQRSLHEESTEDSQFFPARTSELSLLSAGWKWQVQRDFSLQAEASYGLGKPPAGSLDPYRQERSRIIFGTRFDFR